MITVDHLTRVNNDINGNPRYVVHFVHFGNTYEEALEVARVWGGRKYHTKSYGGGIVFRSVYDTQRLCDQLNKLLS